jgi:hypothetical protein
MRLALLLCRLDVDSLVAFLAGRDVERHFLVFLQAFEAIALDRREVREQILAAAVRCDKAETLGVVLRYLYSCLLFLEKINEGLRPKCENFKEENEDLRSTAKAATTDQQFHYLTFLHRPYTGHSQRGQDNSLFFSRP